MHETLAEDTMEEAIWLNRDRLPNSSRAEVDFKDSSFFKEPNRKLPDPATIDASGKQDIRAFPELQLAVKYGRRVTIDEALTMWAIRKQFGDRIPVPELYGWRVFRGQVFIYMELINGVTLEKRWKDADFSDSDKALVCEQLRNILSSLRRLRRNPGDNFIGSINRGPLLDRVFYWVPSTGPFNDLEAFYIWMEWLPQRFLEPHQRYTDPYLDLMPADSAIVFTHADVHRTNIIVSASGPPRILAMIDWGQSGWYPDWWEYYKICYTTHWEDEWRKDWTPRMIEAREHEQYLMAEYSMTIC